MRIAPLLRIVVLGSLPLSGWGQGAVVTSDQASRAEQILTEEAATEPETRWLLTPLEAYDPPFGSLVRYNLGFTRYARRGYPWSEQQQTLQGVTLDHPFTGQSLWNLLRAVRETPHEESVCYGLEGGEASLGGANGVCDYWVVPGKQSQGGYVGWHFTDRRYRQGTRLGLTTGPLGHGWSLLLSGSRRWGRDVHIRGVYADQWSLSAAVEKQWGGRHSLTALFLLAPVEEGVRSSITSECVELTDNPLYNPSWGEQEGSERSARVRRERLPMGVLTWRFTPDERWSVYLSVAAMYGESSHTQLDWYDASSPQPDYYRYLPSAYDNPTVSAAVREAWQGGDPAVTQIDWTELYRTNTLRDTASAAYVLGQAVEQLRDLQGVATLRFRASERLTVSGGVRMRWDGVSRYNRLADLLGASGLVDIDPYLIDDHYYGDKLQNDLRHPNRVVREGEDYGYHYDLHRSAIGGWARVALQNRHNPRFGGYVGVEVQQIALYRQGAYEKELFPGALSCGASPTLRFTDYTLKSGVSYLFTPNHALRLDVLYGDKAPEAEELFLNPEYCNQTLDHPTPAHRFGAELCYRLSGRRVRAELRGYYTSSVNECEVMRYYDDLSSLYADLILRDLRKRYLGVELGVEVRLSECFALRMAAAQRFDRYSRAPQVTILSDKDHQVIAAQTTTLLQGFALGGSPQRVAVGELFFRHPRLWSASVSINYAGDYPLSPSPLRRMRRVYDYATSPEDRAALTRQEYLPEAVTVDLFVMKSFRMGTHYLSLSASVRNLFNRRRNVYSGYETLRVRKSGTGLNQSVTAFPSKYLYAYPRTYYLSLFFRF